MYICIFRFYIIMKTKKEISSFLETEITRFEQLFKASMKSNTPLLDKVTHYIVKRKGKQIRPMFVFLSARLFSDLNTSTYNAASLIELLHTATLVHDDVVDDASFRRSFFSINALWKNKIAVLVGDYLLSKGLLLSVENNEFELLRIVSKAVKEMSEGELLQMEKTRTLNITEEVYYTIIRQKTASLLAACCAAGAYSTTKNTEIAEKMWQFGLHVGMAFQIKDDLLDFGIYEKTGKKPFVDLKEKKLTLPVIHLLNNSDAQTIRIIKNIIKNDAENTEKIAWLVSKIQETGGFVYAEQKMNDYIIESKRVLSSLPDIQNSEFLLGLVDYTIDRTV